MDVLGIDAGATFIKAARFNEQLDILAETKQPSGAQEGLAAYLATIAAAIEEVRGADDLPVGLSVPGLPSKDGSRLLASPNIADFPAHGISLGEELQRESGVSQVIVQNDADCAAVAEWMQGVGKGDRDSSLLHVTWGTGIGTGFVSGGQACYGWEGGHMPVSWDAPSPVACGCGSMVDIEAWAGVRHMLERARQLIAGGELTSTLTAVDLADTESSPARLVDAAEAADPAAQRVVDDTLAYLARGLIQMSTVTKPDIIAIGGGMMYRDWLLDELRRHVTEQATGLTTKTLSPDTIHRAKLENDAGRLGAAVLAQQTFTEKNKPFVRE